jgi:hypothetical protein
VSGAVWLGALNPDFAEDRSALEQIHTDGEQMFTPDWHTWQDSITGAPAISSWFLFHDCAPPTLRCALPTLRLFQPRAVFAEQAARRRPVAPSTFVVAAEDRVLRPEWMRVAAASGWPPRWSRCPADTARTSRDQAGSPSC